MNKEELRKEATTTIEWKSTPMIDRPTFINGYITGAEPREKRIAELEKEREIIKNVMYEFLNCIEQHYYPTEESLKIAKEFAYGKE